jgi:hypothetical protein
LPEKSIILGAGHCKRIEWISEASIHLVWNRSGVLGQILTKDCS